VIKSLENISAQNMLTIYLTHNLITFQIIWPHLSNHCL